MRGFIFDLDGCVWTGDVLTPGAAEVLALLRSQGRALTFLTNNSRARAATMQAKLERLGVQVATRDVLTPLEILGEVLDKHVGPASRVLAIGGPELEAATADGGHSLVPIDRYREAQAVIVGNDFDFSYQRLTVASRAVAAGAAFLTPNLDPRLPVEGDDFLPGCGAIVEAVAAAARSIELNPNFSNGYSEYGRSLAILGQTLEAIAACDTALKLNPRDPTNWERHSSLAIAHFATGDFEAAAREARSAIHACPQLPEAMIILTGACAAAGSIEEARKITSQIVQHWPKIRIGNFAPGYFPGYARQDDQQRLLSMLRLAGLPE